MRDESYTKQQLATEFGISVHAFNKYRNMGLIDPPEGPRCYARYNNKHYRQLQNIRRRLEANVRLDDLRDDRPYHVIRVER